ncbi:type IX secretion system membrane protein PorP/SprF [Paracrocinitomix mangrovi]|uniref:PorP/SprF family type IX secretion system membrane protein n=1 Tax=Paracrocinitomix mangrovi TaxID=2862509 RepID=UPI001C8EAA7B|nr:type IX secretion system membrane protein PorP/SprF [Paracrocinitomix mangrovi]UKN02993.1 type IX secretion system membrane protein PorP/SprF [Paracrocinitomix mangrovi]
MKKLLFILAISCFAYISKAQQQYVFTNFMMNDYYYNPAVAGSKKFHYANLGFRMQWAGFNEAPMTMYANFYGSVKNEMKHGYGISIVNDRSGLVNNTAISLNYAYHVKLGEKWKLGMGVKPGFIQYNIKLYDALLADEGDNILEGNVLSTGAFDLSSGIHLYSERFFFMLSMRHIFGDAITFTGFNDGLSKHYTGIVGYNWWVNKKSKQRQLELLDKQRKGTLEEGEEVAKKKIKDFELMPIIMVNYVNPITPQGTAMLKATFDHKYWAGLSYRTQDALGISLGMVIKERLNIGYSFDYSMGQIQGYNYGSHELMLSFQTTSKKKSLEEQDEELNNSIFDTPESDKK